MIPALEGQPQEVCNFIRANFDAAVSKATIAYAKKMLFDGNKNSAQIEWINVFRENFLKNPTK